MNDGRVLQLWRLYERVCFCTLWWGEDVLLANGSHILPILVGDAIFPSLPWLVCSYRRLLGEPIFSHSIRHFNKKLSKSKIDLERCHCVGWVHDTERRWNSVIVCWIPSTARQLPWPNEGRHSVPSRGNCSCATLHSRRLSLLNVFANSFKNRLHSLTGDWVRLGIVISNAPKHSPTSEESDLWTLRFHASSDSWVKLGFQATFGLLNNYSKYFSPYPTLIFQHMILCQLYPWGYL